MSTATTRAVIAPPAAAVSACGSSMSVGNMADPWSNWRRFKTTPAWWSGRGKPSLSRNDWLTLAALGFAGYYLASYLDFAGLQYISASLERLVLYLNPTLVALLGWLASGRRLSRRNVSTPLIAQA